MNDESFGLAFARHITGTGPLNELGPRIGADKGAPQTSGMEVFTSAGIEFGIWECTPGGWEIEDRPNTETMALVSGRIKITTCGQEPIELAAGDVFVLPKGWSGRWDVLETVRKVYTICG